jgi:hypothetical protein
MDATATNFDFATANERAIVYLKRHESYRPFDEDVLMARVLHYFCAELEVRPRYDRQKQTTAEIAEARQRAQAVLTNGIVRRGLYGEPDEPEARALCELLLEACDVLDASPRPAA